MPAPRTGLFGRNTRAAISRYQASVGAEQSGDLTAGQRAALLSHYAQQTAKQAQQAPVVTRCRGHRGTDHRDRDHHDHHPNEYRDRHEHDHWHDHRLGHHDDAADHHHDRHHHPHRGRPGSAPSPSSTRCWSACNPSPAAIPVERPAAGPRRSR